MHNSINSFLCVSVDALDYAFCETKDQICDILSSLFSKNKNVNFFKKKISEIQFLKFYEAFLRIP